MSMVAKEVKMNPKPQSVKSAADAYADTGSVQHWNTRRDGYLKGHASRDAEVAELVEALAETIGQVSAAHENDPWANDEPSEKAGQVLLKHRASNEGDK